MAPSQIKTKRLILRRWGATDLAPYASVCSDPAVMKFIGPGEILTVAQTQHEIHKMEQTWVARGFGTFAVEGRESGALLGSVGFSWHEFFPSVSPCVEIGWRLKKSAWGKGYATEAANAALAFGKARLGLTEVYCFCQSGNLASQRIASKIGMTLADRVISPTYQREVLIYRTGTDDVMR